MSWVRCGGRYISHSNEGGWVFILVPECSDTSVLSRVYVGLKETSARECEGQLQYVAASSGLRVAYAKYIYPPQSFYWPRVMPTEAGLYSLEHNIRVRLSRYHEHGGWFNCDPTTALTAIRTESYSFHTKIESMKLPQVFNSEYTRGSSSFTCINLKAEIVK